MDLIVPDWLTGSLSAFEGGHLAFFRSSRILSIAVYWLDAINTFRIFKVLWIYTYNRELSFLVILCPYALAGVLTGKMVQGEKARELLQQWKLYFPLDLSESSPSRPGPNPGPGPYSPRDSSISVMTPGPSPNDVSAPSPAPDTPNPNLSGYSGSSSNDKIKPSSPCFVEVIVAGARMWYPSSFVLLVDEDRLTQLVKSNAAVHNRATALPPLVVPPGSLTSAKNVRTKHRTGGAS